jgi:hypothetical protein
MSVLVGTVLDALEASNARTGADMHTAELYIVQLCSVRNHAMNCRARNYTSHDLWCISDQVRRLQDHTNWFGAVWVGLYTQLHTTRHRNPTSYCITFSYVYSHIRGAPKVRYMCSMLVVAQCCRAVDLMRVVRGPCCDWRHAVHVYKSLHSECQRIGLPSCDIKFGGVQGCWRLCALAHRIPAFGQWWATK